MILSEKSATFRDQALVPSEQPVDEPAVKAALMALRGKCVAADGCRRDDASLRNGRRERPTPGKTRQTCDRHTLMRGFHDAAPYLNRQAAAGRLLHGRGIVIAEPDAGHEVAGVTDEPGVAVIL